MKKAISLLVSLSIVLSGLTVFAQETQQPPAPADTSTPITIEGAYENSENLVNEIADANSIAADKPDPFAANSQIQIENFQNSAQQRSATFGTRGANNTNPNAALFLLLMRHTPIYTMAMPNML